MQNPNKILFQSSILQAYNRLSIEIVKGEGCYIFDSKNNKYLDFATGMAVTGLGHNNDYINKALIKQIGEIWHCSNIFTIPLQNMLADRLTKMTFADKVFFCSSGVEAVELAIKLIRKFHSVNGKYRIVSLKRGYHGRSLAALTAGGSDIARDGFGPFLEGFDSVIPDDIEKLESTVTEETAGILLEPVQAQGGVFPLNKKYLQDVRALCDERGILLAFDEVQCGYGRTGKLFAYQNYEVIPDILLTAKGIGNGFPLGACLMKNNVAECIKPGMHGSTYGGNPLAMSVGNAVLDIISEPDFFFGVNIVADYFKEQLEKISKKYPKIIKEVRGVGFLLGLETYCSSDKIMLSCLKHKLAVTCAGNNVIRILPPLIAKKHHIDEALAILDDVFLEL